METEVLEINTSGELILWLHLVELKVNMEKDGAKIILDYMREKKMALAVRNQELVVRDMEGKSLEYQPYSIDDVIHDVCEWNLEIIDEIEDNMKNPDNQEDYKRFSDAHDILKEQERVLDGLYRQTKYKQIAVECALQTIISTLGSVPKRMQEKYRKDGIRQQEKTVGREEENRQLAR